MSEQNKPFVVTDRRKFTLDGEARLDADPSPEREAREVIPAEDSSAKLIETPEPQASAHESEDAPDTESDMLPAPTAEQIERSRAAYEATADRLDTAIRAANPGMEHPPAMSFEALVQSVYMSAIMQLGGATPEGQQPQVDIMGARQSIDMLNVLADKTNGNLSPNEQRLIDSALFELRMAFLELTQALARSAAAKGPGAVPGKPSIVR